MDRMRNTKKSTFWLSVSVVSGTAGLYIGFFALGLFALSVSGSDCSHECTLRIRLMASIGMFLLGISAPSSVYSVFLTWLRIVPASKQWSDMIVIFVGFFVALMTSSSLALLILLRL